MPVVYGGDDGPDLAPLAADVGLSAAEAARLHSGREYTAFMLGFTPGFPYLGMLPERLQRPRRATPRVRVPAGSVAVAGRQTGIYPVASPGGWHVLGRTSLRLFDPARRATALVAPGDRVRFVPVEDLPPPEPARPAPPSRVSAVVEVLEPGLLTTVQDVVRTGHRRVGVSGAGPMAARALAAANAAVKKWQENDPIGVYQRYLLEKYLASEPELDEIDERVDAEVQIAVEFAETSPEPAPEELFKDIYVEN